MLYISFNENIKMLKQVSTSELNNDADYTIAGNSFNSANELVMLTSSGKLPAINSSLLTDLNADSISSGTLSDDRLSINIPHLDSINNFTNSNSFTQVGIGTGTFNSVNPESFKIDMGTNGSNTSVYIVSDNDSYVQMNMQNTNNGESVSVDYVATADNGTPSSNYIDMGINSSLYTANYVGVANDGYVYVDGANLNIGTVSGNSKIILFTNGADSYSNAKMIIGSDIDCLVNVKVPDGTLSTHATNLSQLSLKQNSLGNINGLVKGNGSNTYSAATAGTDYLTPSGNGSSLTNITATQVGLGNVTNDAQLKSSQLDVSTDLGNTTPSDSKIASQKATKAYIDEGLSPKLSSISGLDISLLNNDSNFISSAALSSLTDVSLDSPVLGNLLKYNGNVWVNGVVENTVSAGRGVNFFPTINTSDISNYYLFEQQPVVHEEVDLYTVCNNNKVLLIQFISPEGEKFTKLDAGVWTVNSWSYASDINSSIILEVYKRSLGGSESLLFSIEQDELSTVLSQYIVSTIQPEYSMLDTDRVVLKYYAKTTNLYNTTVHIVGGGADHYSYLVTPLTVDHNSLSGLQGGQLDQYYHISSTLYSNVLNLSGVNTGDETTTTIKSKLGQATSSSDGYLVSTDWQTFNGKQNSLGDINGIVKGNGANGYSTATADTDYLTPSGDGSSLTGITATQVGAIGSTDTAITKQGNTFNGSSQLVQLNSSGYLPALDGSLITNLTKGQVGLGDVPNTDCTNASNISSGTLSNSRLNSSVTVQGNTFNGNLQLVQLNSSMQYPALDGSLITNLTKSQVGLGNVPNTDCTNASNISSGTLSNSRLSTSVTLQGNTFNGISQLVQLNGSGYIPALNGSLLTALPQVNPNIHTNIYATDTTSSTLKGGAFTRLSFPTEIKDSNSEFLSTTYTAKTAQTVLVSAYLGLLSMSASTGIILTIRVNGTEMFRSIDASRFTNSDIGAGNVGCSISVPVDVTVGQTIEIYARHTDGTVNKTSDTKKFLRIVQLY